MGCLILFTSLYQSQNSSVRVAATVNRESLHPNFLHTLLFEYPVCFVLLQLKGHFTTL